MSQTNIQNKDPNDPKGLTAILAGEQKKTKGVEISLAGQLTDQLSVLAGYSYMDGKIENRLLVLQAIILRSRQTTLLTCG